ncbi:SAM-dependent methyltransferase [Pseudonocardia humida]|uniref:SAM-dependent methyltransferase n=1 Tax=Pseudonocardia humida TaxID=2800819 RepID=A0ABT1A7M6_9PSEU|nr:SAM-dependent methyltransferase [Pseudonocardia humida]MCO1659023.1 SAM-dependent methyltransferase [Pseudonocardia humida]
MSADDGDQGTGIDTTIPHSARIFNYWLGGKDHYPVDREAGDAWVAVDPTILRIAREQRAFLKRTVRYLAGEAGIRQFLDVGTGLPTAENTHEVAQHVAPDARIVYVDNDPLILAHARALMTSTEEGTTRYIHADMRDPAPMLVEAGEVLDFDEPVAILFMGVLGHLAKVEDARRVIRTLMGAAAPGSYLLLCDSIVVEGDEASLEAAEEYGSTGAVPYNYRPRDEVASFFDGLELVDPGLVSISLWRPEHPSGVTRIGRSDPEPLEQTIGGLARKPAVAPE